MTPRIVVTGSVATDYLMSWKGSFRSHLVGHESAVSVSFLVDSHRRVPGGCAANIAYGCARLGSLPLLAASVGNDWRSEGDLLAAGGVNLDAVLWCEEATASCYITSDNEGGQITSFYPGAMARAGELSVLPWVSEDTYLVVAPNAPDAMERYVAEATTAQARLIFAPGQQVVSMASDVVRQGIESAFVTIVNDHEASIILATHGMDLRERGRTGKGQVIVTLGEGGSDVIAHDTTHIPALATQVKDVTGGGDSFLAGVVCALSQGESLDVAARRGSITASFAVEVEGGRGYEWTRDQWDERERALASGIRDSGAASTQEGARL